jgi:hypothetical protein
MECDVRTRFLGGERFQAKTSAQRIDQTPNFYRSQTSPGFEVGALYASEKYSDLSPVYHIFKENLILIVFEPMPIKF